MKRPLRRIAIGTLVAATCALLPATSLATPARPAIAVLSMATTPGDSVSGETLSDILADELAKTGTLAVMDRTNTRSLLGDAGFADRGTCESSACASRAGSILSADEVILGSIGRVGDAYMLSARRIESSTGKVVRSARVLQRGALDAVVAYAIPRLATDLAGAAPSTLTLDTTVVVPKSSTASQDDLWIRRHRGFHPRVELLVGYPDAIEAPMSLRLGAEFNGFGTSVGMGPILPAFVFANNDPELQALVPSITVWYAWKYLQFELSYAYARFRSTWGDPANPTRHKDKYDLTSWAANTRFDVGKPGCLALFLGGSALVWRHEADGNRGTFGVFPMVDFGITVSN